MQEQVFPAPDHSSQFSQSHAHKGGEVPLSSIWFDLRVEIRPDCIIVVSVATQCNR